MVSWFSQHLYKIYSLPSISLFLLGNTNGRGAAELPLSPSILAHIVISHQCGCHSGSFLGSEKLGAV